MLELRDEELTLKVRLKEFHVNLATIERSSLYISSNECELY